VVVLRSCLQPFPGHARAECLDRFAHGSHRAPARHARHRGRPQLAPVSGALRRIAMDAHTTVMNGNRSRTSRQLHRARSIRVRCGRWVRRRCIIACSSVQLDAPSGGGRDGTAITAGSAAWVQAARFLRRGLTAGAVPGRRPVNLVSVTHPKPSAAPVLVQSSRRTDAFLPVRLI